jgi:putative endonuclease
LPLFALSRWPWWRRWFGNRSERAAERFLRGQGFRVLKRNYSCPGGELDLVALEGRCLVFVEVRSTAAEDVSGPAISIDRHKQRRIAHAALHFLRRHGLRDQSCRFDALLLSWPADAQEPRIVHHRGAFESTSAFQMGF